MLGIIVSIAIYYTCGVNFVSFKNYDVYGECEIHKQNYLSTSKMAANSFN